MHFRIRLFRSRVAAAFEPIAAAAAAFRIVSAAPAAAEVPAVLGDLAKYFEPEKPYRAEAGADRLAVALGLFPPLQTGGDSTDVEFLRLAGVSRHHNVAGADASLFFGRALGSATGFQFSAVNVVDGPVRGVQFGLLANVAGTMPETESRGVQLALLANWADPFRGVQFSPGFNRSLRGGFAQIAFLSNVSDDFSGVQLSAVNLRGKSFSGAQIGLLNGGADRFSGLQLGLANSAVPLGKADHDAKMDGWQVSLAVNAADSVSGGQFSIVNLASDVKGVQIGLYNQARRLSGVQIGLLNHCDSSDVPFLPLFRAAF